MVVLLTGGGSLDAALSPDIVVRRGGVTACSVLKVIDGDTLDVWCKGRGVERVRIEGLDAPELYSPQCSREWAAAQRATLALRRMNWSADQAEFGFDGQDRYGRSLARLYLDGRDAASMMIGAGHARRYAGGAREGWCARGTA